MWFLWFRLLQGNVSPFPVMQMANGPWLRDKSRSHCLGIELEWLWTWGLKWWSFVSVLMGLVRCLPGLEGRGCGVWCWIPLLPRGLIAAENFPCCFSLPLVSHCLQSGQWTGTFQQMPLMGERPHYLCGCLRGNLSPSLMFWGWYIGISPLLTKFLGFPGSLSLRSTSFSPTKSNFKLCY